MNGRFQDSQRVRFKAIIREKELWLLVILGILYFHRPLFLGETFYFRDLSLHFLPQRQLLVDFINGRELPLWDPYLQGGQPYWQHPSNSILYPSSLLYFFLPLLRAFNIDIVLHVLCYLVFAYLFSRVLGLQPISSFIVSLVYGFCGYTLSLINILNLFWSMSHLPLLLLFWHLFLLEGKNKWFVMTIIVGVIQTFASSPEVNTMSLSFLLGWSLFYPYPCRSLLQKSVLWFLLGIFIVGVASVQIIPAIEIILYSSRGHGLTYNTFSAWSLCPRRLPEIIFPEFLGHVDVFPREVYYWGMKLEDERFPYIISIYLGFIVLTLALIGGKHKSHNKVLPFRTRVFLLSLFILSLLLSLGRYLPFFHLMFQYVPVIRLFRYPIKLFMTGIFPLALLTGYASELHFGDLPPEFRTSNPESLPWFPSLKFLVVLWGILGVLVILTAIFLLSSDFASYFQEFFFKQPGNTVSRDGLRNSFMHTTTIWLLITLLYQYRRIKIRQWQHWLLACIITLDLLFSGKRVNPSVPEEFLTNIPPVVQIIHSQIADGRLFRPETSEVVTLQIPPENIFQVPPNDSVWGTRWSLEVLNSYHAVFYRIPVIFHRDIVKLAPEPLIKLKELIESLPWERRLPLLSASGVTLVFTSDDISISGLHRIAEIPNRSNVAFYLYRNETASDRVEFVTSWKFVDSDNKALRVMLNPDYDSRKQVVLQEPKSLFFGSNFNPLKLKLPDPKLSECKELVQIKKLISNTHSALFTVSNSCDGYLVFSEPFYPGWQVYVDEHPTPLLRANYAFTAIFLAAGEHQVQRFYHPNALLVGGISSVVFCILLWIVIYRYKKVFNKSE
jgi:hypothetical protein